MADTPRPNDVLTTELRAWSKLLRNLDGEPVHLIMFPSMAELFDAAADTIETMAVA